MNSLQERNMELKKLKSIQERASRGIHTHEDYRTMVALLIKLTKRSFERDIQQERAYETHEEIMNEMDWTDFQD